MPSIHSLGILENSFLLKSAQDRQQDRARLGASVTGLTTSNDYAEQMGEAASYLLSELSSTYPDDDSLPLLGVRPRAIGNGQALIDVMYGHSRVTNPTQSPWDLARIRFYGETRGQILRRYFLNSSGDLDSEDFTTPGYYEYRNVSQEDSDTPTASDEAIQVSIVTRTTPMFQIDVPAGLLTSNPLDVMEDLVRHINDDTVTIGGHNFAPGRLKCIGWNADAVDAWNAASEAYIVKRPSVYTFHYSPIGFLNTRIVRLGSGADPPPDIYEVEFDGPSDNFAGAFPTFDGNGPPAAS